jgi:hypothetical protein
MGRIYSEGCQTESSAARHELVYSVGWDLGETRAHRDHPGPRGSLADRHRSPRRGSDPWWSSRPTTTTSPCATTRPAWRLLTAGPAVDGGDVPTGGDRLIEPARHAQKLCRGCSAPRPHRLRRECILGTSPGDPKLLCNSTEALPGGPSRFCVTPCFQFGTEIADLLIQDRCALKHGNCFVVSSHFH